MPVIPARSWSSRVSPWSRPISKALRISFKLLPALILKMHSRAIRSVSSRRHFEQLRFEKLTVLFTTAISSIRYAMNFLGTIASRPLTLSRKVRGENSSPRDAKNFDELRAKLLSQFAETEIVANASSGLHPSPTPLEILTRAEGRLAKKELAQEFISRFFDGLRAKHHRTGVWDNSSHRNLLCILTSKSRLLAILLFECYRAKNGPIAL